MNGDLFLQWLSIRESGILSDAAKTAATFGDGASECGITDARSFLRRLQDLGHIDLSWPENKWRIRPPVLTHLPGSSAFALVLGARTGTSEKRLDSDFTLHRIMPASATSAPFSGPSTLLVEYDSESDLLNTAREIGAAYVPCAALSLAQNLQPLRSGHRAAAPNRFGSPIQMFNLRAHRFVDIDFAHRDGLFRQLANMRYLYWIFEAGTWKSTNYEEGICLIKSNTQDHLLQLQIVEVADDPIGTLQVDARLPLPAEHRRTLTLCCGVSPRKSTDRATLYYNVPRSVASSVATSVHQHLHVG